MSTIKIRKKVIIKNQNKNSKTYILYCDDIVIIRTLVMTNKKLKDIDFESVFNYKNHKLITTQVSFTMETFNLLLQSFDFKLDGFYKMVLPKK